jgi:hypothetical protein
LISQQIDPKICVAGARIRDVRQQGVNALKGAILEHGWTGSTISATEVGRGTDKKYAVIDGMHRITALNQLIAEYPENFKGNFFY